MASLVVFSNNLVTNLNPRYDTFKFNTVIPATYSATNTIEFCICFKTPTADYWDNNSGENYKMTCINPNLLSPDKDHDSNNNLVPEQFSPSPSSIFY